MIKKMGIVMTCFSKLPHSPHNNIAFDAGIDQAYPYNLKSHSYQIRPRIKEEDMPKVAHFRALFNEQDKLPLWQAMRALEGSDKHTARVAISIFIDFCTNGNYSEEDLIELPTLYPLEPFAFLIRANYFMELAWQARGSGTSDTVGNDNYDTFHDNMTHCLTDLWQAFELDPTNKHVWADLVAALPLIHQATDSIDDPYHKIKRLIEEHAMDHAGCVHMIAWQKQTRWGGSAKEGIDWVNQVISATDEDDISRLIIFATAIEHFDYIRCFEEDDERAEAMFKNEELKAELNQYFEPLIRNLHQAPHSIAGRLAFWYSKTKDFERLRIIGQTMVEGHYSTSPMDDCYDSARTHCMMNWIRSI